GTAPHGAASVRLVMTINPADGGGSISVYLDDVRFGKVISSFEEMLYSTQGQAATAAFLNLPKLRGFWPMGSIDSSGNPQDISGQGRNLTNNNAADFGVDGLAPYIDFNGTNQYLSRGDEAGLDVTGALTFGGWFWFDNVASVEEFVIGKRSETANNQLAYWIDREASGFARFAVSSNGTVATVKTVGSAIKPRIGRWEFV